MSWNDKLSVGIEEIDGDHKKMVEMINSLYDGITVGCGKEVVGRILDDLVAYTQRHFAREKQLFAMTAYSDADEHEKEHNKMAEWVLKTQAEFNSGTLAAPSLEVMNHLKDWLFEHILTADQHYASYMKVMGVH